ncbi:NAD-dependent epimerase/dehydratase family protein, partial [Acinetobacter baumannii]
LQKEYSVTILTRHPEKYNSNHSKLSYAAWNVHEEYINKEAIEEADYIIHLAGAGVADKRWDRNRKIEIVESRVQSSALLIKALKTYRHKVKAVIS